jgi:hypothetical protein
MAQVQDARTLSPEVVLEEMKKNGVAGGVSLTTAREM